MAKLWEDSVVTVIRDEKWLHALRHGAPKYGDFPLPQMNMSGRAERQLGDLLDVTQDQFFLFEVKAEREDIEDEWHTKNVKDGHKKKAFLSLHDCIYGKSPPTYATDLIDLSLRGHFLAYWNEEHWLDAKSREPIRQKDLGDRSPPRMS